MTPSQLKAIKDTIKYLDKEFIKCKEFEPGCYQCQMTYAKKMLWHIVEAEKWWKNKSNPLMGGEY